MNTKPSFDINRSIVFNEAPPAITPPDRPSVMFTSKSVSDHGNLENEKRRYKKRILLKSDHMEKHFDSTPV